MLVCISPSQFDNDGLNRNSLTFTTLYTCQRSLTPMHNYYIISFNQSFLMSSIFFKSVFSRNSKHSTCLRMYRSVLSIVLVNCFSIFHVFLSLISVISQSPHITVVPWLQHVWCNVTLFWGGTYYGQTTPLYSFVFFSEMTRLLFLKFVCLFYSSLNILKEITVFFLCGCVCVYACVRRYTRQTRNVEMARKQNITIVKFEEFMQLLKKKKTIYWIENFRKKYQSSTAYLFAFPFNIHFLLPLLIHHIQ